MGKKSRDKGKRGERDWTSTTGGERTWWARHDVLAHGRPWEVKYFKDGFTNLYNAIDEFIEHERDDGGNHRPIVAVRQNGKPWLVIQLYEDWRDECTGEV